MPEGRAKFCSWIGVSAACIRLDVCPAREQNIVSARGYGEGTGFGVWWVDVVAVECSTICATTASIITVLAVSPLVLVLATTF